MTEQKLFNVLLPLLFAVFGIFWIVCMWMAFHYWEKWKDAQRLLAFRERELKEATEKYNRFVSGRTFE